MMEHDTWGLSQCALGLKSHVPGDDCVLPSLELSVGLQKALSPLDVFMALRDFHQKGDTS